MDTVTFLGDNLPAHYTAPPVPLTASAHPSPAPSESLRRFPRQHGLFKSRSETRFARQARGVTRALPLPREVLRPTLSHRIEGE